MSSIRFRLAVVALFAVGGGGACAYKAWHLAEAAIVARKLAPDTARLLLPWAASAFALPAFGAFWTAAVLRDRVFTAVRRLTWRMKDFLVDRYSFQFHEPGPDELGDLQRMFNALAQRTINMMDDMKRLDRAKSEFLNVASHEMRTPLASIKGSLGLLSSGAIAQVDDAGMQLIRIAEDETDRLIRLINDLLDLAKIESGRNPPNPRWHAWDEIARATAGGMLGFANAAGVSLRFETQPELEAYVDKDRIQQALTNLISNAIKFTPRGREVSVAASPAREGSLMVEVIDQGPGVKPEDAARLFQKFGKSERQENGIVKGTGLGLAIAKALVEEQGGQIGLRSSQEQGSVFWFTIPRWRWQTRPDRRAA